jgi:hypothetical protein
MSHFLPSQEQISAAFEFAGLPISAERRTEHHTTYADTLALIRKASTPGLQETVPAVGFKAHWD